MKERDALLLTLGTPIADHTYPQLFLVVEITPTGVIAQRTRTVDGRTDDFLVEVGGKLVGLLVGGVRIGSRAICMLDGSRDWVITAIKTNGVVTLIDQRALTHEDLKNWLLA